MLITIEINPPTFMWFLPNSSIHLTDENPGPVEVEFSELSKENQKLTLLGIKNKQIKSNVDLLNLNDIAQNKVPSHTVRSNAAFNTDGEQPIVASESDLKKTASDVLNKVNATIKKNVESTQDIRLLRIMLELEQSTRNRKTIVSSIQVKLSELSNAVMLTIEKNSSSIMKHSSHIDPLADSMEVAETEVEEVTLDLSEERSQ